MDDFGLMLYNARWYDPTIGRFIQADSIMPGSIAGSQFGYWFTDPRSVVPGTSVAPVYFVAIFMLR